MSGDEPPTASDHKAGRRFPRVSGDEPTIPVAEIGVTSFSPRERG